MPRIIITEPEKSPQPYRIEIDREETTLGRNALSNIILETGSISTDHCVIKRVPGGFTLEDTDSTNGIKLDGVRFSVIDLVDGISVLLGDDVLLDYSLTHEELSALEEEEFESKQRPMLPKSAPAKTQEAPQKEDDTPRRTSLVQEEREQLEEENAWGNEEDEDAAASSVDKRTPVASKKPNFILLLVVVIIAIVLGFVLRHYQDVLLPKSNTSEQAE